MQDSSVLVEKWRTIPDFPNYVISDKGRVASKKGLLLKNTKRGVKLHRHGYSQRIQIKTLMKKIWSQPLK